MMGEELNASVVTDRGLLGDRAYALLDRETDKVVSAKEPRKWAKLFEFRSALRRFSRRERPAARPDHASGWSDGDE